MNVYKVGGCVRDIVLGVEPKDIDYVVTDSSTEEMLSLGYTKVGADFPVFLHPDTGDEYALARSEVSTGKSYGDFKCTTENVGLTEDLFRRDITINAMAIAMSTGHIIDPYNGLQDCFNKIIRHVSLAFAEDPVRVLRIGRFLARLGPDWEVDPYTTTLCTHLFEEDTPIHPDRMWKEFGRALTEPHMALFIKWMKTVGNVIPELDKMSDTDIDKLEKLSVYATNPVVRFALICSFIGPRAASALCTRIGAPKVYAKVINVVCRYREALEYTTSCVHPEIIWSIYKGVIKNFTEEQYNQLFNVQRYSPSWLRIFRIIPMEVPRDYIVNTTPQGPEVGLALKAAEIEVIERNRRKA